MEAMNDKKLYSWFLGPKAENADILEKLVLEALRDCVFWRRNFHPEDDILITGAARSKRLRPAHRQKHSEHAGVVLPARPRAGAGTGARRDSLAYAD
jgi:hypothetical protein